MIMLYHKSRAPTQEWLTLVVRKPTVVLKTSRQQTMMAKEM